MASTTGFATCRHCGSEYRLFTISNRDMQGLCEAWRVRHERGCSARTPAQRKAWARKYVGLSPLDSSIIVDLTHPGYTSSSKEAQ